MARLNPARLSPNERKTLDNAGAFLAQSTRAFESSDLQRAVKRAKLPPWLRCWSELRGLLYPAWNPNLAAAQG
jgi:hypothetical protein